MSSYRYTLSDYHAIKEADISINGITVLAGENGCGKSTLSRWLYYLINGMNRFDEFAYKDLLKQVRDCLYKPDRVRRDIVNRREENLKLTYSRLLDIKVVYGDIESLFRESLDIVGTFREELMEYMQGTDERNKKRILMYLAASEKEIVSVEDYLSLYCDDLEQTIITAYSNVSGDLNDHPVQSLKKDIFEYLIEESIVDFPADIQLYEGQTPLLTKSKFSVPYMLHRAIYIDTPMALMSNRAALNHWKELTDMMFNSIKGDKPEQNRMLLTRIMRSINGRISADEGLMQDKELHYHRSDGLSVRLEDTATGIKSFAYLQRLLENGYLNEESLLLIDEPEAHLHPQWIVEFARLLVLLHKQVGLKIMIATHNPDMVSAIQSIACRESVLENTCFYQAERAPENSMQYVYKNLGNDISEIFKSFNIAISRIQDYGSTGLSE